MATTDQTLIFDGFTNLTGGMDGGSPAEIIPASQVSFAENCTFRNHFITHRPPFEQKVLLFATQEQKDWFTNENFQGGYDFSYSNGPEKKYVSVYSVGGRIFEVNLDLESIIDPTGFVPNGPVDQGVDGLVREITPLKPDSSLDRNSKNLYRAYFVQADKYLVIQDGQSRAIIYTYAGTARRAVTSSPAFEVPVGTLMAYGQNRLFVVIEGNKILAGDILGGGTEVIQFTENTYLAEGGSFSLPTQDNAIQGMTFVQVGDTATGQGELVVWSETTTATLNVATFRPTWKDTPIQRIAISGVGGIADRSFVNINSDVWHRANDGVRSFQTSRRDSQTTWQHTPLSHEVHEVLDNDDDNLLTYASATYFDRRLLMTYGPHWEQNSVAHYGLVVISFENTYSLGQKSSPAWEGFWTGVKPLFIHSRAAGANERCFIVSRDCNSGNQIYEVKKKGFEDNGCQPIQWIFETRKMGADRPLNKKELVNGAFWLDKVKEDVTITAQYRPDYYPCYQNWFNQEYCFTKKNCNPTGCSLVNYKDGYVVRQLLTKPPEICLPGMFRPPQFGRLFQFRFEIVGSCSIPAFQAMLRDKPEGTNSAECNI